MDILSNMITDFYIRKKYVPEEKREIYCYGFKLILSDIINFSIIILLGIIFGKLFESIIFLVTLCSVRQFSGGFHAKTFWMCRMAMMITFLCVITVAYLLLKVVCYNIWFISILDMLSVVLIAILAPVKYSNKLLSEQQRKKNKMKAIIASFILSVISIILIAAGRAEGVTISITLAAVVILMIIGIAVKKGGDSNV